MTINYEDVAKALVNSLRIAEIGSYGADGIWHRKDIYFRIAHPASSAFKGLNRKELSKLFEGYIEDKIKIAWNNYKPEKFEAGIDYVRYISLDITKEYTSDEFMAIGL